MKTRHLLLMIIVSLFLSGCPVSTRTQAPVITRVPPSKQPAQEVVVQGSKEKEIVASKQEFHTVQKGETLYGIATIYGQDYRDVARWNNLDENSRIIVGQMLRVAPPPEELGQTSVVTTTPVTRDSTGTSPISSTIASTATYKRSPKTGKVPYGTSVADSRTSTMAPLVTADGSQATETTSSTSPETSAVATEKTGIGQTSSSGGWVWPSNGTILKRFGSDSKGIDIAGKSADPVTAAADGKVVYSGTGVPGLGQLVIIKHDSDYLSVYAHNSKILVKEGQTIKQGAKIAEMGNSGTDRVKLHFEIRHKGTPIDPSQFLPSR